jgi:hypothetical protein
MGKDGCRADGGALFHHDGHRFGQAEFASYVYWTYRCSFSKVGRLSPLAQLNFKLWRTVRFLAGAAL